MPEHKATGGRLSAGTPYLVGDDPNGRLTHYSELFVPDTSGYLLNASSTAALLAGNSGSTAVEATAVKSGDTYQITIVIEGDRNDLAHVAEAAEMGISRAMSALEVARATGKK
ncbi:MAG: hypothetical protein IPK53_10480 [bacterium]|nr:hypothetical protein [bacterium]